jgi:hypothetical protein
MTADYLAINPKIMNGEKMRARVKAEPKAPVGVPLTAAQAPKGPDALAMLRKAAPYMAPNKLEDLAEEIVRRETGSRPKPGGQPQIRARVPGYRYGGNIVVMPRRYDEGGELTFNPNVALDPGQVVDRRRDWGPFQWNNLYQNRMLADINGQYSHMPVGRGEASMRPPDEYLQLMEPWMPEPVNMDEQDLGQPGTDQVVPEPSQIVGESGKVYGTLAEGGADERVTITPLEPKRATMAGALRGVRGFATGGELYADGQGLDPNDDAVQRMVASGSLNYGTPLSQVSAYRSPAPAPAAQTAFSPTTVNNNVATATGTNSLYDVNAAQDMATRERMGAQGAALDRQSAYYDAQGNVNTAQQGLIAPKQATIAAQANIYAAQGQQTNAQRSFIGEQQRAEQARLGEIQGIQAASQNVEDIQNVARTARERSNTDYRYGVAGLDVPTDVKMPVGYNGPMPVGQRAALQTQEQAMTQQAQEHEAVRASHLKQAALAVDLIGTDVDRARNEAAKIGLTLDQAQLVVEMAQNQASAAGLAADRADLGVSRARIAEEASNMPSTPGFTLYTDPFTGQGKWVSQAEKGRLDEAAQLEQARVANQASPLAAFGVDYIKSLLSQPGSPISVEDAMTEFQRRGMTPEQAKLAAFDAAQGAKQELSYSAVIEMIVSGVVPEAEGRQYLLSKGFSETDINRLVDQARKEAQARASSLPPLNPNGAGGGEQEPEPEVPAAFAPELWAPNTTPRATWPSIPTFQFPSLAGR